MTPTIAAYIPVSQLAKESGFSIPTLHRWITKGKILGAVQTPGGMVLVPKDAAEKLLTPIEAKATLAE
jgi:predicted site-specific integrase-resolvase